MKFYMGTGQKLSDDDFARLAKRHDIEEARLRAVAEVEARNTGFHSSGALVCLYEPHIAYKYAKPAIRVKLEAEGLAYKKWGTAKYPKSSYSRIDRCALIAGEELAALASSWGMGQILGPNHKACGYPSALAMVKDFAMGGEAAQLEGMIRFIKANPDMDMALHMGNWAGFALRYNGAGYAKNAYDAKLAKAYAKWSAKLAARPKPVEKPKPAPEPVPVKTSEPMRQPDDPGPVAGLEDDNPGPGIALAIGAALFAVGVYLLWRF